MRISYSESMQLRGLAILLMIWLHCFNKDMTGETYISILPMLGGATFPYLLTRVAQICVALYCFLSGYGLYLKYPYQKGYISKKGISIVKQYWFVLVVFAVIGYMFSAQYDFSFSSITSNLLGYDTTWNVTLWFMLPYFILLLISKWVFKFIDSFKIYIALPTLILTFIISMIAMKSQKMGVVEINVFIKNIFQVFRLLLPFVIGAYCKKYERMEDIIQKNRKGLWVGFALILLLSRFFVWNHFTLPLCCLCFVFLYHVIDVPKKVQGVFEFLGQKSLYMWFCHAYFLYYFLKEYTFAAQYAILIYLLAIIYSLACAIILEYSYKKTLIIK